MRLLDSKFKSLNFARFADRAKALDVNPTPALMCQQSLLLGSAVKVKITAVIFFVTVTKPLSPS
jgi:hypothetical protein